MWWQKWHSLEAGGNHCREDMPIRSLTSGNLIDHWSQLLCFEIHHCTLSELILPVVSSQHGLRVSGSLKLACSWEICYIANWWLWLKDSTLSLPLTFLELYPCLKIFFLSNLSYFPLSSTGVRPALWSDSFPDLLQIFPILSHPITLLCV